MPPAARSRSTSVTLVALLLASGCLSGGGAGSSAAGPTRAQFIARATAICARFQHRIDALPPASDLIALAGAGRSAIALERAELRGLQALTPPAADRRAIATLLASLRSAITAAGQLVDDAAAGDRAAVSADAANLSSLLLRTNQLAKPFGLGTCTG
jgi:hypothetical protein